MHERESLGSNRTAILLVGCLAGGIIFAALWTWPPAHAEVVTTAPSPPPSAHPAAPVVLDTASPQPRPPLPRVDATKVEPQAAPMVFAECVERLCSMSLRIAELAQDDEIDEARALDAEVRTLADEVLSAFADAAERSMSMVTEMADPQGQPESPPAQNTRLAVLQVLAQSDLVRRHMVAEQSNDRSRIDALVQFLLDSMPISTLTAQMGDRLLHQRPYLRATHEQSVLHLLQMAGRDEFPREIATNLLLTLWDNLKATGERSATELSQLAMMRLDSSDPSQILAACRQLLGDASYRGVALAWLRERKDRTLAGDIADLAAQELPVEDALEVLRELSPLLGHRRGTYLALGARDPDVIVDAYREHLATDNQPEIRRELVMGVGMLPNGSGLDLAKLALNYDPSPLVRIQAVFVYSVHAPPEAAEQSISQLLDDPAIANDQTHLAAIVMALENLEHRDANSIARLGARLQSMSLSEITRENLTQLLARALPGGGHNLPSGGR